MLEIWIALVVIIVLSALMIPAIEAVGEKAKAVRALAAGRSLVQAYMLAAQDRGGRFLEGYAGGATAYNQNGERITGVAAARYPWRLAPYVDYQFKGTMYVNEGADHLDLSDTYLTSLAPSFGLNAYCLGGYADGSGQYQVDVARRGDDVRNPARMIVFASSHVTLADESGNTTSPGFHMITPPSIGGSKWSNDNSPAATGYVDFRYDQKAMVVFLDGHVEMMALADMTDSRLWSPGAQKADNPNYAIPRGGAVVGSRSRK